MPSRLWKPLLIRLRHARLEETINRSVPSVGTTWVANCYCAGFNPQPYISSAPYKRLHGHQCMYVQGETGKTPKEKRSVKTKITTSTVARRTTTRRNGKTYRTEVDRPRAYIRNRLIYFIRILLVRKHVCVCHAQTIGWKPLWASSKTINNKLLTA